MTINTHSFAHFFTKIKNINTPGAIIIAALLLSISHVAYGYISATGSPQSPVSYFKGRAIDDTDYLAGKADSKVIVMEYSDTECPFCAQLSPTLSRIKQEYSSKVAFAYRYFPLTQIHPHAFDEAKALECVKRIAGGKKRDEYIDQIFSYKLSKQNMVLPENGKIDLAKNIGVDANALTQCLAGQDIDTVVNNSISDGVQAGVEGTPATFILVKTRKGYEVVSLISGAQSYDYFKAAIDEALSKS